MAKQSVHSRPLGAFVALCFGILCVGVAAIFVKLADVPGPVSAFYRTLVASSVIVPWWLAKSRVRPAARDTMVVMLGGVIFALTLALWNTSILLTSAATATLLINSAPLWVGLASFMLFRENLSRSYWIGLTIAMGGMVWLIGADAYEQLHLSTGNLLALGSGVTYAVYLLTTQRTRSRVDLLTFVAISLISSVVVLLIFNIAIGTKLTGYPNRVWMALIGLGLVSQLGGWLSINYALGHMRAAQVSVWLLSESVVTAVVAMLLLNERLQLNQVIGGIMIMVGIYFVTKQNGDQKIKTKS
jgi:drug/metabolite transporter (DMT)-like permease